jgi:hypothetical protein
MENFTEDDKNSVSEDSTEESAEGLDKKELLFSVVKPFPFKEKSGLSEAFNKWEVIKAGLINRNGEKFKTNGEIYLDYVNKTGDDYIGLKSNNKDNVTKNDNKNIWKKFKGLPKDKRLIIILAIWTFFNLVLLGLGGSRNSSGHFYPFFCNLSSFYYYDFSEFIFYVGGAWGVFYLNKYINKNSDTKLP